MCLRSSTPSAIFTASLCGAFANASRGELEEVARGKESVALRETGRACICVAGAAARLASGCFPALLTSRSKKPASAASGKSGERIRRCSECGGSGVLTDGLTHGGFTSIRMVTKIFGATFMAVLSHSYAKLPAALAFPAVGFAVQAAAMGVCTVFAVSLLERSRKQCREKA